MSAYKPSGRKRGVWLDTWSMRSISVYIRLAVMAIYSWRDYLAKLVDVSLGNSTRCCCCCSSSSSAYLGTSGLFAFQGIIIPHVPAERRESHPVTLRISRSFRSAGIITPSYCNLNVVVVRTTRRLEFASAAVSVHRNRKEMPGGGGTKRN